MELEKQRESNLSLKRGIFKEELKNRFLCLVEVDGKDTLCYIPSSCRLSNFLDLSQKAVLLKPVESTGSRTKYSVFAVNEGNNIVLLNTSQANKVILRSIRNRRFYELGKRKSIKKEYSIEGYKCDLYIEDTKTIVEIKSLISLGKEAQYPTVYSKRAIDQLSMLCDLLDKGYRVCYIFVSLNPKVQQIIINENDMGFRKDLICGINKGMIIKALSLTLDNGEPKIFKSLKIIV